MPSSPDGIVLHPSSKECYSTLKPLLTSPEPLFLSRIGGSDTDVVVDYFHEIDLLGPDEARDRMLKSFHLVKRFNGYYDALEKPENAEKFCRLILDAYFNSSYLFLCGSYWLTEFFPESIDPEFQIDTSKIRPALLKLCRTIGAKRRPAHFFPYSFIERILLDEHTLFRLFAETFPGKSVLAVTPFADSIVANFPRRQQFFPGFDYPDFELSTYNTPITYEGLPAEFYPDQDWFETLDRMKREIAAMTFDVALLSCGSYAMPLGLHIRDVLKKKAIYVGGCLQLFFGIMGRRYDNPFFTRQINREVFTYPLERERYLKHVAIDANTAREAFGAYF